MLKMKQLLKNINTKQRTPLSSSNSGSRITRHVTNTPSVTISYPQKIPHPFRKNIKCLNVGLLRT